MCKLTDNQIKELLVHARVEKREREGNVSWGQIPAKSAKHQFPSRTDNWPADDFLK